MERAYQQMVEAEWRNPDTVNAWARWHGKLVRQSAAMTEGLLRHADVRAGMQVLDLASGSGDPALTLAQRVGDHGHVTATDLSEGMLDLAQRHAHTAQLANMSFRLADAQALPFDDASFDVVTSRLGIMYFVDVQKALSEIARVLKPGGRMAFAVWGPTDQGTFSAFLLGPLMARRPLELPPPDMPFPLRFATPGSLSAELRRAGLADVTEENAVLHFVWPGPPEEVWAQFYDLAIPMRPYLDSFTADQRAAAFQEALSILPDQNERDNTDLTAAINFAVART
jgi:SAM-dependent methyltransferase